MCNLWQIVTPAPFLRIGKLAPAAFAAPPPCSRTAKQPRHVEPRNRPALRLTPLEDRITPAAADFDFGFGPGGKLSVPFNLGGANADAASAVAVQADGKIVIVGTAQITATDADFAVTRLNRDGTPDATFGPAGKRTIPFNLGSTNADVGRAIAVQADGKILVAGTVQRGAVGDTDYGVARLNDDGTLDTTFDTDGKAVVAFDLGGGNADVGQAVLVQPDGKIILAGTVRRAAAFDTDFGVARLDAAGALDPTFGTAGKTQVAFDLGGGNADVLGGAALQADGKIVLAGSAHLGGATDTDFAAARLTAAGVLDTTFDTDGKRTVGFDLGGTLADAANALAIQPDGKIVLAGSADSGPTGPLDFAAARLNADGSSDTSFDADGRTTIAFDNGGAFGNADQALAVALQADGKIVLAGQAGSGPPAVARLTTAGAPDAAFAAGGKRVLDTAGASAGLAGVAVQADRRVVVAGSVAAATVGDFDFFAARLAGDTVPLPTQFAAGSASAAQLRNADGTLRYELTPFAGFTGGVRVAAGDFNKDGVADLVAGTGPGVASRVRVFDGKTQAELFSVSPVRGQLHGRGVRGHRRHRRRRRGGPHRHPRRGRRAARDGVQRRQRVRHHRQLLRHHRPRVLRRRPRRRRGQQPRRQGRTHRRGGVRRRAARHHLRRQVHLQRLDARLARQLLRLRADAAQRRLREFRRPRRRRPRGPDRRRRPRRRAARQRLRRHLGAQPRAQLPAVRRRAHRQLLRRRPNNRGGVRVAMKDLDGDGMADLVTGPGTAGGARVLGYAGKAATVTATPPAAILTLDPFADSDGVFVG